MLRKLIVLVCLISLAPVSAGAQELAAALLPREVVAENSASAATPMKILVAASDRADDAATDMKPQKETKSRPSCTLGEFFDIHFGGYRWLWWAGAAAALVAIHVAAAD